jgi:5-methylcytosine-specific restriction enzyme subunit McrC
VKIPIRNLYYLLAYAWNRPSGARLADASVESCHVPEDLFALLLNNGIRQQIRRGLDRGYSVTSEALSGVRGRIDVARSVKTASLLKAQLWCDFDELSHDVLHNQILKATLRALLMCPDIARSLHDDSADVLRYFGHVSDISLNERAFRQVQLHSNNRPYRFLLHVCELLFRQLLPQPNGTGYKFLELPDEQLDQIFESFVRNFYAREQSDFPVVKVESFAWNEVTAGAEATTWLPRMKTDASLISKDLKVVVETKFYGKAFVRSQYGERESIRSLHLYQLFAYLRNLSMVGDQVVSGLLLYAAAGQQQTLRYVMHGHDVVVATLDLTQSPAVIRERLLEVLTKTVERPLAACTQ